MYWTNESTHLEKKNNIINIDKNVKRVKSTFYYYKSPLLHL